MLSISILGLILEVPTFIRLHFFKTTTKFWVKAGRTSIFPYFQLHLFLSLLEK